MADWLLLARQQSSSTSLCLSDRTRSVQSKAALCKCQLHGQIPAQQAWPSSSFKRRRLQRHDVQRVHVAETAQSSRSSEHASTRTEDSSEGVTSGEVRSWLRTAVLQASKQSSCPVQEADKPLAEYMTLPASQYSVLDAKKIDRIDDRTFRCYVDGIHFLGLTIEPVLTVSVTVGERGPTVKLLNTRLEGSDTVLSANEHFDATMTNVVQWTEADSHTPKQISSDTTIKVELEVPRWMKFMPKGVIERVGSSAMQQVLNRMVPRFLSQLQKDYAQWAAGDESRKPVGTGQL